MKRFTAMVLAAAALAAPASGEEIAPNEVAMTGALTVEAPLTATPGDAFRGLQVFIDRKRGNCVACHTNFDVKAMQFLGEIGPSLDWVGDRWSAAQLRAMIVDAKRVFGEQTIMPAFYVSEGGFRTLDKFEGKPILTAQEVEDVVAYLSELKKTEAR